MAPHLDTEVNLGEGTVRLRTNAEGHRVDAEPLTGPSREILALGDSFLAALQVESSEIFVNRLARNLSRSTTVPLRAVNTGVGGWGPSHYLLEARQELATRRFTAVLVAVFLGNDMESSRRDHFPAKVSSDHRGFHLPSQMSATAWKFAFLYPMNDWLERRSHLFILMRTGAWQVLMRLGLSARRFPTACLVSEAGSDRWRVTAEVLRDIHLEAEKSGVQALFVLIPGAYQIDEQLGRQYARNLGIAESAIDLQQPARLLLAEDAMAGLAVIDASGPFRQAFAEGVGPLYGAVDTHLAQQGHMLLARLLTDPMLDLLNSANELQPPE